MPGWGQQPGRRSARTWKPISAAAISNRGWLPGSGRSAAVWRSTFPVPAGPSCRMPRCSCSRAAVVVAAPRAAQLADVLRRIDRRSPDLLLGPHLHDGVPYADEEGNQEERAEERHASRREHDAERRDLDEPGGSAQRIPAPGEDIAIVPAPGHALPAVLGRGGRHAAEVPAREQVGCEHLGYGKVLIPILLFHRPPPLLRWMARGPQRRKSRRGNR